MLPMQMFASAVIERKNIPLDPEKGTHPWNLWFNDELQCFMRTFLKDLNRELIGQRNQRVIVRC
jgi:hypothetical protein